MYIFDTTSTFFERMNTSMNIPCKQLMDLNQFTTCMDNLTTLLNLNTRPCLILIDDVSNFILNNNWNLVTEPLTTLKRLNCIIILLNNQYTDFTLKKYELNWNPMIDTRLFFGGDTTIKVIKSRG